MNNPTDRSIPALFSDAIGQLAKLIGNEFDLAKAEISEKAARLARGATMIGAGAVIIIPALVLLLFSGATALAHTGLSDPVAYLLTGGAAALVSAALVGIGISRMSAETLKPSMTIDQMQQDKAAVREMVE